MMTMREAMLRAEQHQGRIKNTGWGDYKVTLNEWHSLPRKRQDELAYFTDDLEDAVLTLGAMRRRAV